MGPAGSGKGTMSTRIIEEYGIPHLSTGDLFRDAIKNETVLGKIGKQYIDQGKLVPDKVTIALVEEKIAAKKEAGYLLDGFPRTMPQALAFDKLSNKLQCEIDLVLDLEIDDQELVKRITGRRLCKNCGAIYHIDFNPSEKEGICDECGNVLIQRSDDTEERLSVRLKEHRRNTEPVLAYYDKLGLSKKIDASQNIEKVWEDIKVILEAIND